MAAATLLTLAFPPLAFALGLLFIRFFPLRLRDVSAASGVACLLFGAVGAWAVIGDVSAGVVQLRTRSFGTIEASASRTPWMFWDEILLLYALSLALCAFGVATIARAWRRGR